jgi:large subunit ribosomal protein L9
MELAEQMKVQGIEIDRKKIMLAEPIRHLGEFTTTIKLHPEVSATLKVIIIKPE